MTITLNADYDVTLSTALLGYVGETNARPVTIENMEIDGADRYVLTIDYGDGTAYEVDITGGQWTPTADILRSAQTVSCQIAAKKLSGQEYILVKKSRIFRLRIGAAIGDNAVPSPDVAMDALDRIDAIGRQAHADMQKAKSAADTATTAAENAEKSATTAGVSADTATQAASRAETAKTSAETSATQADTAKQGAEAAAQTAQAVADSLPDDYVTAVEKIAENTAEIGRVKLADKELKRRVDALFDIGQGITHRFETDSETAYAKTVPTGAKLMGVKSIGGHSEVIDGEIVSAGTEEVVEQGKNLFDYTDKTYHGANVNKVENGVIYTKGLTTTALNIPTIAENKYTLSFKVKSNAANQGGLRWSLQKGKNTSYAHDSSLIKSEVGYTANTEYQAVATFVATTDFVSLCTIVGMVYDVQLELGDTATDYSPFYQTEYPIPEAIKALPGYGWSAGTARNYVDYENKRYVQCVQSVNLGTLTWARDSSANRWYNGNLPRFLSDKNAMCSQLSYIDNADNLQNGQWGHSGSGYFEVYVADATTSADVAKKMSGVILYYKLATPIITDISTLIDDDFLRNLTVEAGGSITFKNSNDNYHIPVPSEEEYIVKLSEVGGTT